MTLAAGARLRPYEILALLGAGRMGEVYRAKDTRLGRDVRRTPPLSGPTPDHVRILVCLSPAVAWAQDTPTHGVVERASRNGRASRIHEQRSCPWRFL